jgi:hypothetical protein
MIEDWWGRQFEGRGSITLSNMPDNTPKTIRRLATEDVLELIRSEDTRSVRGLAAHMELRRRQEWTARAALIIAVAALIVSAIHP